MVVRVTVGPSVPEHSSAKETQVEILGAESAGLSRVLDRLGLSVSDPEGGLLVFVNGALVSLAETSGFVLRDGDHLSLHRMLSGG